MFQISMSSSRKAASALTVLAAMGASGMVADVASAAPVTLDPTQGARGKNHGFIGSGNPDNWVDWLPENTVTYHGNIGGPAFATWGIDFGAGAITSAMYRLDANGTSFAYGIPAGATLEFALITEPWSPSTPDSSSTGPDVGTNLGTDFVQTAAAGGDQDVDVTPLLLTWQTNPAAYYGIRFKVTDGAERGGVQAPGATGITADLIVDQVPEPGSLSVLALGTLAGLRRRRRK